MFNLNQYLSSKREQVNQALDDFFAELDKSSRLIQAMRYSIMAGGKRLRPVLCISAFEAIGGKEENIMLAACALEMIHTYSLIHDDLPAMDNDDLRRGQATCHKKFDEAIAILAGDALLTAAFQILASACIENRQPKKWMQVIQIIASTAGHEGMIEGQIRDIEAENRKVSLQHLKSIHLLKTGALIKASVYSGAVLGGALDHEIKNLLNYADCIGLAFQVVDDLLNINGDPKLMGKAVGTDSALQKSTYPSLIGIKASKNMADALIHKAIDSLNSYDEKAEPLRAIAMYIIDRKR
ncbi:Geranylgeranyl pyrophosphate synthase [Candidatus Magnetomoraceae bacterium gMMP-15]